MDSHDPECLGACMPDDGICTTCGRVLDRPPPGDGTPVGCHSRSGRHDGISGQDARQNQGQQNQGEHDGQES